MKLTQKFQLHGRAIRRVAACLMTTAGLAVAQDTLREKFVAPPDEAKPRVYWWWLNNLVSQQGITRDLEEFKAKENALMNTIIKLEHAEVNLVHFNRIKHILVIVNK